jgi:hypothetical protein
LKVARTIEDLAAFETISSDHGIGSIKEFAAGKNSAARLGSADL